MQPYSSTLHKGTRGRRQQLEPRIYHRCRPKPSGGSKQTSPPDLIDVYTLQVDRRALARERVLGVVTVHLDIANSRPYASGQDFQLITHRKLAGNKSTGDYGSESSDRERPVNR